MKPSEKCITGSAVLKLFAAVILMTATIGVHAQDAFKCGTRDLASPTRQVKLSGPEVVVQSASCEAADPIIVFDPTIPSSQQDEIRQDVSNTVQFFCAQLPYRIGQVTIFAFANISAYANRYGVPLSEAQQKWNSNTAEAGYNTIDIYTGSLGWQQVQPFDSHRKIITHELFHVIQYKLANANKKPLPLPVWLIEGAAEYIGFAGLTLLDLTAL